jgi:hypothetical protein
MHRNIDEVHMLTDDQRLREIARILAAGVLRLRARVAIPPASVQLPGPQILLESSPICLEVPPETVLSGPHGLTVSETSNGRKT